MPQYTPNRVQPAYKYSQSTFLFTYKVALNSVVAVYYGPKYNSLVHYSVEPFTLQFTRLLNQMLILYATDIFIVHQQHNKLEFEVPFTSAYMEKEAKKDLQTHKQH